MNNFEELKAALTEAATNIKNTDTSIFITSDLHSTDESIVVIGNAENTLDICSLLTAVLCDLTDEFDDEDKQLVKNAVHVAMNLRGAAFTDLVKEIGGADHAE